MEEYLPHYERELAFLRQYAREFAQRYPKIASRLLMTADVSEDPHVERLFESFALMAARISKNLEDDYSEFTEALLGVMYPHYLRPFPPTSVVRFQLDGAKLAALSAPVVVPRGKELLSRPGQGVQCRFRTVYDVTLSPLQLTGARFLGVAQAPSKLRLPPQASAQVSLDFAVPMRDGAAAPLKLDAVRLFTDGDPAFCGALRDALSMRVLGAYVEPVQSGRWIALDRNPLAMVGFEPEESLIPADAAQGHDAYRLLTEFFAFPDKFGFFDLDLRQLARLGGRQFTLHLVLKGVSPDSPVARLLEDLGPDHVLLGCTPVVNLFPLKGEAITVGKQARPYPVVANAQMPHAYEVYTIDKVSRVVETPHGEVTHEVRPMYALRHGEGKGQYWLAHRDGLVAKMQPGHELSLHIVDHEMEPALPQAGALDVELTCSNRDLASRLAYGSPGGDFQLDGGSVASRINLLRRPTQAMRFRLDHGGAWDLISQMSMNPFSLEGGVAALKEMLRLYDLPRSALSARLIDGVVDIAPRAVTAWLPAQPTPSVVRGLEIRLTLDEEVFATIGLCAFAEVMDRFFALYANANGFVQLVLVSSSSGEELLRCAPRRGDQPLI